MRLAKLSAKRGGVCVVSSNVWTELEHNAPGRLETTSSSSWKSTRSFGGTQTATPHAARRQTLWIRRDPPPPPHPSLPVAKGPFHLSWIRLDQVISLITSCPLTGFTLTPPTQFVKLCQRGFVNLQQINTVPTFPIG